MSEEVLVEREHPERLSRRAVAIIGIHAFIGWALCTASMGISMATTTVENALIVHAVAAPIIFTAVSLVYFNRFNYTTPLRTGLIFVGFVILMDFFVVSLLVLGNFEMFASLLGTWIPFSLILASTYLTGTIVLRNKEARSVASVS
ncbi:MAG: hypothetical protein JSW55_01170 [Chloroflexota bacterium]|nr:MAG: hypothetical protein JSW55_01170 [Chloroflexota bacterium]